MFSNIKHNIFFGYNIPFNVVQSNHFKNFIKISTSLCNIGIINIGNA